MRNRFLISAVWLIASTGLAVAQIINPGGCCPELAEAFRTGQ